jgi:hypothetical protein
MPLNDTDKSWVREAIRDAGQKRGLVFRIKEWGGLAAIVPVAGFLLVQWNGYSRFRATAELRMDRVEKSMDQAEDRVRRIEQSIQKISDRLDNLQLHQIVSSPLDAQSARLAGQIVESAKSDRRSIDPEIVEATGKKLVSASQSLPVAWETAVQFLNYKSFMNQFSSAVPDSRNSKPRTGSRYRGFLPNEGRSEFSIAVSGAGSAPEALAAQFHPIGEDPNPGAENGDAVLFVRSDGLILDDMELRNVVIMNTHVIYNGGPLKMRNVFFVDCTFEVKDNKATAGLVIAALSPPPSTSFSAN